MYLEELGFRAIGRILKISYSTVYQWIKKWDGNLDLPKCDNPVKAVEPDEIHTYIGQKTAGGYGLLLIDIWPDLKEKQNVITKPNT
jgi:transposase